MTTCIRPSYAEIEDYKQTVRMLEEMNGNLREAIDRHLEVYREQALELIELRIKRETLCRIATELIDEAAL